MKYLAILALVPIVHGLTGASPAAACSCAQVDIDAAIEDATAIFEGRVDQVVEAQSGSVALSFSVVRVWKGDIGQHANVYSSAGSGCGFQARTAETYLMYARARSDGELQTDACSRSRPVTTAQEDLTHLGAGVVPFDLDPKDEQPVIAATAQPPPAGGCATCTVGTGTRKRGPLALGALSSVWLWAARRRTRRLHRQGRKAATERQP